MKHWGQNFSPRALAARFAAPALIVGALLIAAPSARATGETPDGWITAKVKIALLTEPDVGSLDVNVDTYDGKVTLHGKAGSAAEKRRAGAVARDVSGVKDVRNLLAVVPAEQRKRVEVADEQLERRVGTVLKRDASLSDSDIQVKSVNKGVVVLEGDARSLSDHLRAIEDARAVQGVTQVASDIRSPDTLADNEIWAEDPNDASKGEGSAWDGWTTAAVKLRLLGNRDIPGLSINVDTRDGVVTLFGVVPSAKVSDLAEREAMEARGARRVDNELQVVPEQRQDRVEARDGDIQKRIDKRMDAAAFDGDTDVDFEVRNGVVRVTGSVPSSMQRLEILTLARSTEGVRSVLDDMTTKDEPRRERRERRDEREERRG